MEDQLQKYNALVNLVESVKEDADKFFVKGNKAAGTRVRKSMQDVKRIAQEIRVEVSTQNK